MAEDQKKKGAFSGAFKNLGFASRLTGNPTGSPGLPKINTSELQPQDSIPEIVGSPTDVGIYDGGHQGAKVTWAKFFEDGAYCRAPSNRSRDNGSRRWGARRGTRHAARIDPSRSHVLTFSRFHVLIHQANNDVRPWRPRRGPPRPLGPGLELGVPVRLTTNDSS